MDSQIEAKLSAAYMDKIKTAICTAHGLPEGFIRHLPSPEAIIEAMDADIGLRVGQPTWPIHGFIRRHGIMPDTYQDATGVFEAEMPCFPAHILNDYTLLMSFENDTPDNTARNYHDHLDAILMIVRDKDFQESAREPHMTAIYCGIRKHLSFPDKDTQETPRFLVVKNPECVRPGEEKSGARANLRLIEGGVKEPRHG